MSSGHVGTKGTPRQLVLLLSDGRFDRENKDRLRKLVREMNERGQLLVLIGALSVTSHHTQTSFRSVASDLRT